MFKTLFVIKYVLSFPSLDETIVLLLAILYIYFGNQAFRKT